MRGRLREPPKHRAETLGVMVVSYVLDQAWMRRKRSRPKSWRCASIVGSSNLKVQDDEHSDLLETYDCEHL